MEWYGWNMPEYLYGCEEKHRQSETHGMTENPPIVCVKCGKVMHRIPQVTAVNWGGLPPHLEHLRSNAVQNMITNADENRAKYLETKGK